MSLKGLGKVKINFISGFRSGNEKVTSKPEMG